MRKGLRTMDLKNKIFELCVEIEKWLSFFKGRGFNSPTFDQIKRSSTSIGANYCEAMGCYTDRDYRKTIAVSLKECNETMWWVDILNNDFCGLDDYITIMTHLNEIKEELENLFLYSVENSCIPTEWGERLKGVD